MFPEHQTDAGYASNHPCWWSYEFPNGLAANVVMSKTPFRFDLEMDNPDAELGLDLHIGLSTAEVEARLTELAARPAQVTA